MKYFLMPILNSIDYVVTIMILVLCHFLDNFWFGLTILPCVLLSTYIERKYWETAKEKK